MKPFFVRFCLRFGLAVLIVVAGPFAAELGIDGMQVAAAEDEEEPQKTRRVPTMSEQTFKKLSEAQELIDLKDFVGALATLDKMLERSKRMNGNEIGAVHNMRGFVFFSDEKYEQAISAYEMVVAQGEDILWLWRLADVAGRTESLT